MTNTSDMTDAGLLDYLVDTSGAESKLVYAAHYFEGVLLTLMARDPKVRKYIEERVKYRMSERG